MKVEQGRLWDLLCSPEGRAVWLGETDGFDAEPTTLQLTLACPRNDDSKTTLRVHHEELADGDEREAMREHWRAVLDRIEATATGSE